MKYLYTPKGLYGIFYEAIKTWLGQIKALGSTQVVLLINP